MNEKKTKRDSETKQHQRRRNALLSVLSVLVCVCKNTLHHMVCTFKQNEIENIEMWLACLGFIFKSWLGAIVSIFV